MIKINYKICSIGLFFLFIGILFSPSFVANHLSPDGVLQEHTVKLVQIFRFGVIALGVLITILGILFEKWKFVKEFLDRIVGKGNFAFILIISIYVALSTFYIFFGSMNNDEGWYLYASKLVYAGKIPYT